MKLDRITTDPAKMNGQPCIRDLRLTVKQVLEILATYPERAEIRTEYPELEDEDIHQALVYDELEHRLENYQHQPESSIPWKEIKNAASTPQSSAHNTADPNTPHA